LSNTIAEVRCGRRKGTGLDNQGTEVSRSETERQLTGSRHVQAAPAGAAKARHLSGRASAAMGHGVPTHLHLHRYCCNGGCVEPSLTDGWVLVCGGARAAVGALLWLDGVAQAGAGP
jgi:hypothetical protein